MKFRHAAALALVGWYLMVPSLNVDPPGPISRRHELPLSEWVIVDAIAELQATGAIAG